MAVSLDRYHFNFALNQYYMEKNMRYIEEEVSKHFKKFGRQAAKMIAHEIMSKYDLELTSRQVAVNGEVIVTMELIPKDRSI